MIRIERRPERVQKFHSDTGPVQKLLFLEQAEGYVKALEKSTYPLSTMK